MVNDLFIKIVLQAKIIYKKDKEQYVNNFYNQML